MDPGALLDSSNQTPTMQKASLPIARNNGPGYERPERARTSHACEPCRERKTKCDGERPSCRRCLHTGTGCHYGYGKGWRKRKTAEDLNATSKKLQRYEALLNDIIPMVNPDVRAMIDDVRQQEVGAGGTPESIDSSSSLSGHQQMMGDRERSASNTRLPLPLPLPNTLSNQQSRAPPQLPFDRMSESTSPHLAHHPKRDMPIEDHANGRLPSITPNGLLIENGVRDASPTYPRAGVSPAPPRVDHFSPTNSASSFHDSSTRTGWSSFGLEVQHQKTDSWSSPPTPAPVADLSRLPKSLSPAHHSYSRSLDISTAVAS